jgi:hypothetical protein
VERENLDTIVVRPRARGPAHRGGGSTCQRGIAVGLDLDLHAKITGRVVQQLLEEHRRLCGRGAITGA